MTSTETLSSIELASIEAAFREIEKGIPDESLIDPFDFEVVLLEFWGSKILRERGVVLYQRTAPDWFFVMTDEFKKSIRGLDKKLQGRILEAISNITKEPTTLKGDTVKPLTSSFRGLWRYRLGDYRLVYRPDIEHRQIVLLTFASRGDVYS